LACITIQENGHLVITITGKDEFDAIVEREFQDERDYLCELMEAARYIGNDWHCLYDIGFTEVPAIGQGAIYSEDEEENDGFPVDYENLWYFGEYMLKSYIEILQKEGKVIFTGHRENRIKQNGHD
jgi:hypothetical protein